MNEQILFINARQCGKIKLMFERLAAEYAENPKAFIVGPNSVWPKHSIYEANKMRRNFVWDWDMYPLGPNPDPEVYAAWKKERDENLKIWSRLFIDNLPEVGIKGKAIFISTADLEDKPKLVLGYESTGKSGLLKFFKPVIESVVDKYSSPINKDSND